MRIYWKTLVGYGFVFWLILCITDFLGVTNVNKYSKDLDELYEKPLVVANIEKQIETRLKQLEYKGIKFGWSLFVWNTVTFVFSIIICSIGRTVAWTCWGLYRFYRNRIVCSQLTSPNQYVRRVGSRIPIIIKPLTRSSDTNLPSSEMTMKIETEKSCPNLFIRRSGSNLSSSTDVTPKTCRTIFRKDVYLCDNPDLSNEQQLERQCTILKEELHRLQTTSLKEHAILSRKLDSVSQDNNDIGKQLTVVQKENRAAKQQLEELLQEKSLLLKKLENATKEFKCNTKTKKYALAKLEEVTNSVDELRQQLEQVSRDKEILEKKLKLLEIEYNKLHERYIASQQRLFASNCSNENLPERDENSLKEKRMFSEIFRYTDLDKNKSHPAIQQTSDVLASVSQTELDMKKIQEKIKQLEKNLENLNIHNNEIGYSRSLEQLEIQALTSRMQEKARFLGNIRERTESAEDMGSSDSDEGEPKRLVSSSVAFKNFLKSLNKLDAAKRKIPSNTEVYF